MRITTGLNMSGIKELEEALRDRLPPKFANAVAVKAFKAGADIIAAQAKANAAAVQDLGLLAASIGSKANSKQLVYYVGRKRHHVKGEFIISGIVGSVSKKSRVYRIRKEATGFSNGTSKVNPFGNPAEAFARSRPPVQMTLKGFGKLKAATLRASVQKFAEESFIGARRPGYWQWANPARYAHLVEFGTCRTAAKPFMRPAIEQKGQAALTAIAAEMERGLPDAIKAAGRDSLKYLQGGFKK